MIIKNMNFAPPRKNIFFAAFVAGFITVFFFQVLSFIFSNEINGIHIGKRRARLSTPSKQSVSLQLKYTSMEDVSVETETANSGDPELDVYGYTGLVVKNHSRFSRPAKQETSNTSSPPLYTLYRTYRI